MQHQLTEEKPQEETNDNHHDTHNATHGQGVGNSHVPQHNTELLMGK